MENNSVCKFRISKDTSGKCPVFLIGFTNGCLNFNNAENLSFISYCKVSDYAETDNQSIPRILTASSNRLTYKGCTFTDDDGFKFPIKYFIGVRNKETGRMKLYSCILLHLKPLLKVPVLSGEASGEDESYRTKLDSLALNFGNKMKKRAVNARIKYSITSPAMLCDALNDVTINEPIITKHPVGPVSGVECIPPQNHQAQFPSEVYCIHDIITQEEEEHLSHMAQTLLNENCDDVEKWKDDDYCNFVLSRIKRGNFEKVKYLLYYNYMVVFSKLTYSDIKKKDPAPSIPEPFKSKLLDNFTISSCNEHGKYSRKWPPKMKDKLFAYMFVLALIIDDYCVNISSVLDGLKRSLSSAVAIAQALGCHIVQRQVDNSAIKFAELKLPLSVPKRHFKKRH